MRRFPAHTRLWAVERDGRALHVPVIAGLPYGCRAAADRVCARHEGMAPVLVEVAHDGGLTRV